MRVGLDFWGWRFKNFCSIPGWFLVIWGFSSYSMQTCYLSNLGCPSQSRHPKIASWPAIFDDRSRAPQDGGIAKECVLNRPLNRRLTDTYLAEVISSIPNMNNITLEWSYASPTQWRRHDHMPHQTFARFQAGFLSSEDFHRFLLIFIDLYDFHRFS